MEVYLIRHGETEYNAEQRYQGTRDIPLSEDGIQCLHRAEFVVDTVYVTPLQRTQQTAKILFPEATQVVVEGLREMNFGIFEGKNHAELSGDPIYDAWIESEWVSPCPEGEGRDAFEVRTCTALTELIDHALARGEERLVIVAHGGTQMAALHTMGYPQRRYREWLAKNGCGYVLSTEQWKSKGHLVLLREWDNIL